MLFSCASLAFSCREYIIYLLQHDICSRLCDQQHQLATGRTLKLWMYQEEILRGLKPGSITFHSSCLNAFTMAEIVHAQLGVAPHQAGECQRTCMYIASSMVHRLDSPTSCALRLICRPVQWFSSPPTEMTCILRSTPVVYHPAACFVARPI